MTDTVEELVYSEAETLLIEVQRRVIKVGFFYIYVAFNIYKENDFKGYIHAGKKQAVNSYQSAKYSDY